MFYGDNTFNIIDFSLIFVSLPSINNIPRSESPQQSNIFMDQINTNNTYQNDYQYGNSNNIIRSRSLPNGSNALRPANIPTLRRSQSSISDSNLVNNNIIKPNKTSNYKSHNGSGNNISQSSHVLTPFDYTLSNPTFILIILWYFINKYSLKMESKTSERIVLSIEKENKYLKCWKIFVYFKYIIVSNILLWIIGNRTRVFNYIHYIGIQYQLNYHH